MRPGALRQRLTSGAKRLGLLLSALLTLPNVAVAQSPVPLPIAATPVELPRVMPKLKRVGLPDAATRTSAQAPEAPQLPVDLPLAATLEHVAWPNPSSPPAWIQWLGWSDDGHRLEWRQGPEWAQMLPGTPIEIARLDDRGNVVTHLHQRENPAVALKTRHIRTTEPLFVERKTDRDVLLQTSTGRMFAVVVRPGRSSVAAILEKNHRSYEPIARWPIRGSASRVDVMAFEDLSHRLLALVIHADSGPLRQAHVAVVPLSRKFPVQVSALTLPEAVTATSPRRP